MPKRREAVQDEFTALAAELRRLWRPGEPLRPWLRKHRQMVLDLVHDEWSWEIMAKAFSLAKIKYQAGRGKDWHGEGLRREFVRAALPLQRDKKLANVIDQAQDARSNQEIFAEQSTSVTYQPEMATAAPTTAPRDVPLPRFKPVSLRPAEPRHIPSQEELAEIEQNRRLTFGRS
jgi:hypothetical protein